MQDLPELEGSALRGRITIYCVAETLNRDLLSKKLRERGPQFLLHSYPDVLYGRYCRWAHAGRLLRTPCAVSLSMLLADLRAEDLIKGLRGMHGEGVGFRHR